MSAGDTKKIRVVLLGNTRVGKSSLGNALLGREEFVVGRGMSSGTQVCQNADVEVDDMCLQVTDTPGLLDIYRLEEEMLREAAKCITLAYPGPHVVLLVFRCDRIFTKQHYNEFQMLKSLFGASVCNYSIVVFVRIHQLTSEPDKRQALLKEALKSAPKDIQQIVSDCSHRCFGIGNGGSVEDRKSQAEELRGMIKSLVQYNRGTLFPNSLCKEVNEPVEWLIEQHMNTAPRKTRQLNKQVLASLAFPDNKVRLVLIGKTGVGKSSVGNTILGSELFPPVRGFKSGTEKCNWKFVELKDLKIEVTDTPGVCDTHRTKDDIQKEIAKCLATVTPGPHAVLMVFKGGDRFTQEEGLAYEELKKIFGPQLVKHMILIFTGIDKLEQEDLDLPTAITSAPDNLKKVLKEASGRYVGFNNKASWSERIEQRDQLLKLVRQVLKNNRDKYYSNKLMKMFEKTMQKVEKTSHQDREHIKEGVVRENPSFLGRFRECVKNVFSKFLCEIM